MVAKVNQESELDGRPDNENDEIYLSDCFRDFCEFSLFIGELAGELDL